MGAKNLAKFKKVEQVQPIQSEYSFVKPVDYETEVKDELVMFLTLLFRFLIGEGHDISEWDSLGSDGDQSRQGSEA